MLFVEFRFFIFFAIVFAIVWGLRGNTNRKLVLTFASYVFYAAWDWRFLGLILLVTAISYIVGRRVEALPPKHRDRRRWLIVGIGSALAVLGLFKYFNFFSDSFSSFAGLVGLPVNEVTLSLVLPVGISFYTFQAISYVVDIARGHIKSNRAPLDVAFYIAFFPQLVAGPIVRASEFVPQMQTARRWSDVDVRAALILFLVGFVKKAGISDNVAPYVDQVFQNPETFTAFSIIGGVLLYAVQIYCDFSGYSDMAIATAALLGYKFSLNFDAPYLSPNIQEFWRRWHISLSSWLRDYLYIPLGGNRHGDMRRNINLMTTMLLGGLWHGASFNFVIWGGLHGLALIVERSWNMRVAAKFPAFGWVGAAIGAAVTVYWVCLAWIFFRAPTLEESLLIAHSYLTLSSPGDQTLPIIIWPMLGGLGLFHWLCHRVDANAHLARLSPTPFAVAFGATFAVAVAAIPLGYRPFIYFQF